MATSNWCTSKPMPPAKQGHAHVETGTKCFKEDIEIAKQLVKNAIAV
ncbi:MAG: hypothetical protein IPO07_29610 [Haliscomenobacter sp.]|nr:hypothetical protein [Haliscomenobacter sp.]MBK9492487.1 hypothetical protein [Haliscomenobacter sp.]